MRKFKVYIALILVIASIFGLYYFSLVRNSRRSIEKTDVEFLGSHNLFMSRDAVSKLLIQKRENASNVTKEVLDLNTLEVALNSNAMIENAQVSVSVTGTLLAKVTQRKPIARVITNTSYYIDRHGKFMPLSNNYSERVPIVTGYVYKDELDVVYRMATKILKDSFLRKNVVQIHQNKDRTLSLKLRKCDFSVYLGHLEHMDKKINNLKAFYIKARKDKLIHKYSKVNLQFDNQVVCTKV